MQASRAAAAFFVILVAGIPGCQDATRPSHSTHPIVGTYDVKTTLNTATYRGPCSPPSTQPYCYNTVPVAGMATLTGTIVIGDSVVTLADSTRLPLTSANLTATSCGYSATPCSQSVSLGRIGYDPASIRPSQIDRTNSARLYAVGSNGTLFTAVEFDGTFAGDSIYGTVSWVDEPNRTYAGTFVARRQVVALATLHP